MSAGTYTDLSGRTVTVSLTDNGYMLRYVDGETVFV